MYLQQTYPSTPELCQDSLNSPCTPSLKPDPNTCSKAPEFSYIPGHSQGASLFCLEELDEIFGLSWPEEDETPLTTTFLDNNQDELDGLFL